MSTEIHAQFADAPLNAIEGRLLGSLIEKQATTPEAYPLTLNALVLACNQKTSREPVMNVTPGQAGQALRNLEARSLVKLVMGSRADRWEQRTDKALELVQPQLILIGLLLLRGPQTLGELLTRSNRMSDFDDTEHVRHQLDRLIARGLVLLIPRQGGQREDRYMHLMGEQADLDALLEARASQPERGESRAAADARIEELEARVADLEARLARLEDRGE
ncbi:YceH family protein [Pseudomonas sp. TCU-HL1]|uniref:YceH family protein n=1 Tax=Pseudomonas sp. TCU-HL1 TaxID=1856685 RepID=UPI00083CD3E7|nr:DUF480 domain-containing protein [Pseudomonas sp. TCU-HL1]AOE84966.1 hypothetical protein THL1_2418 [Pseudomonas sp. TCU-HL1]